MYLLDFDMAELIGKATAPVARCINLVSAESLFKDFADVLKDELGLFKGIEAKITKSYTQIPLPQTSSICFEREGGSFIECLCVCRRIDSSLAK